MKLYSTVASRLEAFTQMIGDLRSRRVPALCVGLSAIHKAHGRWRESPRNTSRPGSVSFPA